MHIEGGNLLAPMDALTLELTGGHNSHLSLTKPSIGQHYARSEETQSCDETFEHYENQQVLNNTAQDCMNIVEQSRAENGTNQATIKEMNALLPNQQRSDPVNLSSSLNDPNAKHSRQP